MKKGDEIPVPNEKDLVTETAIDLRAKGTGDHVRGIDRREKEIGLAHRAVKGIGHRGKRRRCRPR